MRTLISIGQDLSKCLSGLCLSSAEGERGQALLETVMTVSFLVVFAVFLNKMLPPVVVEAFEKVSRALSSVGP
jgi:hypothetical protein